MKIKSMLCMALISTALGLISGTAEAQNNNNRSPYSRYGYGSMEGGYTAGSKAMGGLSVGLRDGMITNPSNPASYTAVDSITFIFDLGLSGKYNMLQEGSNRDSRYLGGLDYFNILYRLHKRLAMSAGIAPLSTVGYNFGYTAPIQGAPANDNGVVRTYSGSGSYNNLYLGLGANPWKGLHLGLNTAFVFGHTTQSRQLTYLSTGALNSSHNENLHLRGFKLTAGAQYEFKLDTTGTRSLVLGATFTPEYRYSSERTIVRQDFSSSSSETMRNDTITNGRYTNPLQIGAGLSYRVANSWMVGADVRYTQWSKAQFEDLEAQFQDQYRIAIGGEWTPNHLARSPWQRATYRMGLTAGNSYLAVPLGNSGSFAGYREYGVSAGLSLPLVDRRSAFNLSFDYKYLKPQQNNMISEHYLGATIGILFNEGWFRKARVN